MKRIVITNSNNTYTLEVRNINLELKEYIPRVSNNEEEMAKEDNEYDNDDSKAPCDHTVVVRRVAGHADVVCRSSKRKKMSKSQD